MPPSNCFRTGRRSLTQSSVKAVDGQDSKWMSGSVYHRNRRREARTRAEGPEQPVSRAPPERVRRAFALLTRTHHGSRLFVEVTSPRSNYSRKRTILMLDSADLARKGHPHDSSPLGSGVGRPCSYSPCFAKIKLGVVQFRGFSKMTLSSLPAQAPRVILSDFSPSNCTEKSKRKPACQTCQLRAP
jgi:hypothetical protein